MVRMRVCGRCGWEIEGRRNWDEEAGLCRPCADLLRWRRRWMTIGAIAGGVLLFILLAVCLYFTVVLGVLRSQNYI